MKHAGAAALKALEPLLVQLRALGTLAERRPGIFYRRSSAFLHFHEDPAGLFADVKLGGGPHFQRLPVGSRAEQQALLAAVQACLRAAPAAAARAAAARAP